jgi:hypothetical protein
MQLGMLPCFDWVVCELLLGTDAVDRRPPPLSDKATER